MKIKYTGSFSKFIISLVIALNIIFTIAVFAAFLRVGDEPTALIVAWFAFTTGELWMLASIKKKEIVEDADMDCIDELDVDYSDRGDVQ